MLRGWAHLLRPALVVTQGGDEIYVQRLVSVTGIAMANRGLVHRHGEVEVYELATSRPTR
jgi:hypothetical protein